MRNALSSPRCILGSHRRKKLRHQLALLRERAGCELLPYYGANRAVMLTGPAGTGFAEDVYCFHAAAPPRRRDRLVLMLQFTARDYGTDRDTAPPGLLRNCV